MLKNILKFLLGVAALAAAGIGILYGVRYFQYFKSPEYKAAEDIKRLEKQYAQDPYGGETPEETLRLFIEALKKGDTDLAAKYFILDKQQEWREDLTMTKEKRLLDNMIKELGNLKLTKKTTEEAFFTLIENNEGVAQLIIKKIPLNNRWKIIEL